MKKLLNYGNVGLTVCSLGIALFLICVLINLWNIEFFPFTVILISFTIIISGFILMMADVFQTAKELDRLTQRTESVKKELEGYKKSMVKLIIWEHVLHALELKFYKNLASKLQEYEEFTDENSQADLEENVS